MSDRRTGGYLRRDRRRVTATVTATVIAVVVGVVALAVIGQVVPGLTRAWVVALMAGWAVLGAGAGAVLAARAARRVPQPGVASLTASEIPPVATADQAQGFGWMKASDLLQHRESAPQEPLGEDQ
jgi:hypothetical protein